jgi:hypothetical protein
MSLSLQDPAKSFAGGDSIPPASNSGTWNRPIWNTGAANLRNLLIINALTWWRRGSRNILRIENTQVIENARRTKHKKLQNCALLERIWNAGFSLVHLHLESEGLSGASRT